MVDLTLPSALYTLGTSIAMLVVLLITQAVQARTLRILTAKKAAELAQTVVLTANTLKEDVQMAAQRRETKLDEIHVLVNSRLTEALARIDKLEQMLERLGHSIPPDDKRAKE